MVLRFTTYSSNMSVKHVFSVALNRMLWQMLYCSGTETRGINEAAAPSKTIQGDKNVNVVHCQHGACPLPPTPKKKPSIFLHHHTTSATCLAQVRFHRHFYSIFSCLYLKILNKRKLTIFEIFYKHFCQIDISKLIY